MTKQNYIDQIFKSESVTNPLLTKQWVEVIINNVYNQMCWDLTLGKIKNFDLCRKHYVLDVVWDSTQEVYYSNYPAPVVPNINSEMIVEAIKGSGLLFYTSSEKIQRRVYNLISNTLNRRIPTILKRERIEYVNMELRSAQEIIDGANPTPRFSTVKMNLAIEFKAFASTDVVYMPAGRDYEVMQLVIDYITKNPVMEVRNG